MRRTASAEALSSLPRAPKLAKVVEDEVEEEEDFEMNREYGSGGDDNRAVTRAELKVKEKLFQAMYYCAKNDLAGLKLVYHSNHRIISEANYDNRTCLHIAAASGNINIVSWLLSYGAPTDPIDNWGHTPWHEARRGNHTAVARILETRGKLNATLVSRDQAGKLISGDMDQWGISLRDLRKVDTAPRKDGANGQAATDPAGESPSDSPTTSENFYAKRMAGPWKGSFATVTLAYWRGLKVAIKRVPHLEWSDGEPPFSSHAAPCPPTTTPLLTLSLSLSLRCPPSLPLSLSLRGDQHLQDGAINLQPLGPPSHCAVPGRMHGPPGNHPTHTHTILFDSSVSKTLTPCAVM